jgi:hypothetical protein
MNTSISTPSPAQTIVGQLAAPARRKFGSDARWATASGIPKETLCRLKKSASCDLRTLAALANAAGMIIAAVPVRIEGDGHLPTTFGRAEEAALLDFCAAEELDPTSWVSHGPAFFMAGLATLLASARGFDRRRYLDLAEALHPGITVPEVFASWLKATPVRAARFLPQLRKRLAW